MTINEKLEGLTTEQAIALAADLNSAYPVREGGGEENVEALHSEECGRKER